MKENVIFLEPTIMPNWFEDFGDSRKYYGSSLTRVPNPPKGPGIIPKLSDIFFTVFDENHYVGLKWSIFIYKSRK